MVSPMRRTRGRQRDRYRHSRVAGWPALFLILALVAAGCGSSNSNATRTATTASARSVQPTATSSSTPVVAIAKATPVSTPAATMAATPVPTATNTPTPEPSPTVAAAITPTAAASPASIQQAGSPPLAGGAEQPDAAFKAVNWKTVLANDPNFQVNPKLGAMLPDVGGIFITYKREKLDISGYPDLTSIQYGNIGDGQQSAVIPVISGGSSGITGVLIYQIPAGASAPKFIDAAGGYNLAISIQGGNLHDLQLTKPIYNGWEPNCCPSGLEYVPYKIANGKLTQTGDYIAPAPGSVVMTVQHFYDLLANKQYKQAYRFFTAGFQQANPYQQWLAGYANTQQITAHVAPLSNDRVTVNIQSVDLANGNKVTKHFSGSWTLTFADNPYQWFLDKASIQEVP